MSIKIKNSKYKSGYDIIFNEGIGRYIVLFSSPVLDIQAQFIVPDDCVDVDYDDKHLLTIDTLTEKILVLNFWYICLQKEQSLKVAGDVENAQPG